MDYSKVYNVTLVMEDQFTGEEVIRTIDKSNAMTNGAVCWEMRGEQDQREALERWINDRGNEQHETILELRSWSFN